MTRHYDLDALRAARAEAAGDPPTVTLAGETFTLPVEMPWAVVEALAHDTAAAFRDAALALLGGSQYRRACELGVSRDDMGALVIMASQDLYVAGSPEVSSVSEPS